MRAVGAGCDMFNARRAWFGVAAPVVSSIADYTQAWAASLWRTGF